MTTHRFRTAVRWLLLPVLTLALATSAYADGGHGSATKSAPAHAAMPGMSADEHAQMSSGASSSASMPGMSADEHAQMSSSASSSASMPGMSADEHAHMSDGAGGHGAMPGMDMGHNEPATTGKRPVGLLLGGFGLVNALVLAYAAVIRRRPDALRRRQTVARVRCTAPVRTVPASTPKPGATS